MIGLRVVLAGVMMVEGKDTDDMRNEFCWRLDNNGPAKVLWFCYVENV